MKEPIILLLTLLFLEGCDKGDDIKTLSPANGTHLMSIHAKGIAGSRGGSDFDSTYSDYLTITGTWDSIYLSCPNIEDRLYVITINNKDSLCYYKPWPPYGSGYSGFLYYSKLTQKIFLNLGYSVPGLPHYGRTEYTLIEQ